MWRGTLKRIQILCQLENEINHFQALRVVESLNVLESIDEAENVAKRLNERSNWQQSCQIVDELFLSPKYIKGIKELLRIQDSCVIGRYARLIVSNGALNSL